MSHHQADADDAFGHVAELDVGGGLGVDYDGSRSAFDSSTNYTLQEYTNDVVYYIGDVCNAEKVPHPDIVSESGRALVAHHSVLIVEVFGAIAKVRPDVNSVCHHHAPSVLPFCATGVELMPLFHLGGTLGAKVPFWDSRDEFGDTNLLVSTPEQGASHARALGPHYMLLLRRHGASLAGKSLRECVFRSIYSTRNAELQLRAMAIGAPGPLSPGEMEKCGGHNLGPRGVERAWEYWVTRLQKAEAMWGAAGLPRLKDKLARPQTAGMASAVISRYAW